VTAPRSLHAASRLALEHLRRTVDEAARESRGGLLRGRAIDLPRLAEELYAVAELLAAQPRLRRSLADPATPAEGRARLIRGLLQGKMSDAALQITDQAVSLRWSAPWDLVDALETSGDEVLLAAADRENALDTVEDQLFRMERILDAQSDLSALLDEAVVPAARRVRLLDDVLKGKAHPVTRALLDHAVASQRKRTAVLAIDSLIEAAAARRHRSLARVLSATELSDDQQNRLSRALSQLYGRTVEVRYAVDPAIRGGLVVRVGDDVIDGSVASRLTRIRAEFAG
jgi:F-type H+-transporting ATPase subunit delta